MSKCFSNIKTNLLKNLLDEQKESKNKDFVLVLTVFIDSQQIFLFYHHKCPKTIIER